MNLPLTLDREKNRNFSPRILMKFQSDAHVVSDEKPTLSKQADDFLRQVSRESEWNVTWNIVNGAQCLFIEKRE